MKKNYYRKYGLLCLLMLSAIAGFAQTGSISGRVLDETQQPIPGASVTIDGTTRGAATDASGNYKITGVSDGSHTLNVQFLGFAAQTKTVTVAGNEVIANFDLKPESQSLNEVVVIGYGSVKRKDLTGSVTTVSAKDFNKGSLTSPEQLIAGKVAGVQVLSTGGAPGASTSIRIRGGASLNASLDPLFVIDGVPLDNKGISGIGNPLSTINPNDIETFTVLKDASATAIYGSRASNGVIIITTKRGEGGGPLSVQANSIQSISNKTGIVDVLNAQEYKYALKQYLDITKGDMNKLNLLGDAKTNWQEVIYQQAFKTDNTVAFSGGIKGLPYRVSAGYLDEDGILKTSNFNRASGAINITPKFLDNHLSVSLNVKGSITKSRFANTAAVGSALSFNPTQPVHVAAYDPNQPLSATNTNLGGYYEWVNNSGVPILLAGKNPLSILEQQVNKGEAKRSIGNLQVDYKFHFLPELRANVNVGYDVSRSDGSDFLPATLASAYSIEGSTSIYSQNKMNKLLDFYLNYNKEFKSISSRIDATAGYSYQDWVRNSPATLTPGKGVISIYPDNKTQNTLISYFGRVNYTFKDRYLLTGTVRADGSSRFPVDNKWAIFPSGAFAWDIKEESFVKDSKTISQLKLRVGYGITGQQDLPSDYPYLAKYNTSDAASSYPFGDTYYNMLRPDAYDPNIKWEETATYNVGVDFGFADGRISGTIDYFNRKTSDLLSTVQTPIGSNFTNRILTNVGNIESKGFELNLNVVPVKTKDVNWNVNFNASHYDNKVTKITLSDVVDPSSPGVPISTTFTGEALQYHKEGFAPYTYYVRKQLYDDAGKPMEGKYADLDGDGVVGEKDFYRYKSPNPTVLLGLSSNLNYKQWSFAFTMRANLGAYNYNGVAANTGYGDALSFANFLGNASGSIRDTRFIKIQQYSDYYIEKASFVRMDNVNLGYDFGRVARAFNMAVNFNVQNVFVITDYTGLDPELASNGIDNNFYPRPRIYSLGVNLGF